jgi:hypothetical protein
MHGPGLWLRPQGPGLRAQITQIFAHHGWRRHIGPTAHIGDARLPDAGTGLHTVTANTKAVRVIAESGSLTVR